MGPGTRPATGGGASRAHDGRRVRATTARPVRPKTGAGASRRALAAFATAMRASDDDPSLRAVLKAVSSGDSRTLDLRGVELTSTRLHYIAAVLSGSASPQHIKRLDMSVGGPTDADAPAPLLSAVWGEMAGGTAVALATPTTDAFPLPPEPCDAAQDAADGNTTGVSDEAFGSDGALLGRAGGAPRRICSGAGVSVPAPPREPPSTAPALQGDARLRTPVYQPALRGGSAPMRQRPATALPPQPFLPECDASGSRGGGPRRVVDATCGKVLLKLLETVPSIVELDVGGVIFAEPSVKQQLLAVVQDHRTQALRAAQAQLTIATCKAARRLDSVVRQRSHVLAKLNHNAARLVGQQSRAALVLHESQGRSWAFLVAAFRLGCLHYQRAYGARAIRWRAKRLKYDKLHRALVILAEQSARPTIAFEYLTSSRRVELQHRDRLHVLYEREKELDTVHRRQQHDLNKAFTKVYYECVENEKEARRGVRSIFYAAHVELTARQFLAISREIRERVLAEWAGNVAGTRRQQRETMQQLHQKWALSVQDGLLREERLANSELRMRESTAWAAIGKQRVTDYRSARQQEYLGNIDREKGVAELTPPELIVAGAPPLVKYFLTGQHMLGPLLPKCLLHIVQPPLSHHDVSEHVRAELRRLRSDTSWFSKHVVAAHSSPPAAPLDASLVMSHGTDTERGSVGMRGTPRPGLLSSPAGMRPVDFEGLDTETYDDWVARKTVIHGGKLTVAIDTGYIPPGPAGRGYRHGDTLDLEDKIAYPDLALEGPNVLYAGKIIAVVQDLVQDAGSKGTVTPQASPATQLLSASTTSPLLQPLDAAGAEKPSPLRRKPRGGGGAGSARKTPAKHRGCSGTLGDRIIAIVFAIPEGATAEDVNTLLRIVGIQKGSDREKGRGGSPALQPAASPEEPGLLQREGSSNSSFRSPGGGAGARWGHLSAAVMGSRKSFRVQARESPKEFEADSLMIDVALELLFPCRAASDDDEAETVLRPSAASCRVQVQTAPSRFSILPGGSAVLYKDGDGPCGLFAGVSVAARKPRKERDENSGESPKRPGAAGDSLRPIASLGTMFKQAMQHSPQGVWEGCTLTLRCVGTSSLPASSRDFLTLNPSPPADDPHAAAHAHYGDGPLRFDVVAKARQVLVGTSVVAHVLDGHGLKNLESQQSATPPPSAKERMYVRFKLTELMRPTWITPFLHSFSFKNESSEPHDGTRVVELSLEDPDGDVEKVRISVEITSENAKTCMLLNRDSGAYRRRYGDLLEAFSPYVVEQQPTALVPEATITDHETDNFASARLTITVSRGTATDSLVIESDDVRLDGTSVVYRQMNIAEAEYTRTKSGALLALTFIRNASIVAVQSVLRAVGFMTDPMVGSGDATGKRAKRGGEHDSIPGLVKTGVREVDIALYVNQTDPVVARLPVRVWNPMLTIPAGHQVLSLVDRDEAVRLSPRYDLSNEVTSYAGGSIVVDIVDGNDGCDGLDLLPMEGSDLTIVKRPGPPGGKIREIYSAGRVLLANATFEDTKGSVRFMPPQDRKGTIAPDGFAKAGAEDPRAKMCGKREVMNMLRLLGYTYRGDTTRMMKKIIRVALDDGTDRPSVTFIQVVVQPLYERTRITRPSLLPMVYQQGSQDDLRGFCPFEECSLYDPDTDNFSDGYLEVDLSTPCYEKGADRLWVLSEDLQRQRGEIELFQTQPLNTNYPEATADHPHILSYCGTDIGTIFNHGRGSLSVQFARDCPLASVAVVAHLMHFVQYQNVSARLLPCTVAMAIRVCAGGEQKELRDGLEGRLDVTLHARGPLLALPDDGRCVSWQCAPVILAPKLRVNLPGTHRCERTRLRARVLDAQFGDHIYVDLARLEGHWFLRGGGRRRDLVHDSLTVGSVSSVSGAERYGAVGKDFSFEVVVDFASDGSAHMQLVEKVMRIIAFDAHSTKDSSCRSVEVSLALGDAAPTAVQLQLSLSPPAKPVQLVLTHREFTVYSCMVHFIFPDLVIEGDVVEEWMEGTSARVEVVDPSPHDVLDVDVIDATSEADGMRKMAARSDVDRDEDRRPSLFVTPGGWVKRSYSRLANISGRGSAALQFTFFGCPSDLVLDLLRSIKYTCTEEFVDENANRLKTLSVELFPPGAGGAVQKTLLSVDVQPMVLGMHGHEYGVIHPGEHEVKVVRGLQVNLGSFSGASLSVAFVKRWMSDVPQKVHGWQLCLSHRTISITPGTNCVMFNRKPPFCVLTRNEGSMMKVDFPTPHPNLIIDVAKAVAVRCINHWQRHRYKQFFLRLELDVRAFTDGSFGRRAGVQWVQILVPPPQHRQQRGQKWQVMALAAGLAKPKPMSPRLQRILDASPTSPLAPTLPTRPAGVGSPMQAKLQPDKDAVETGIMRIGEVLQRLREPQRALKMAKNRLLTLKQVSTKRAAASTPRESPMEDRSDDSGDLPLQRADSPPPFCGTPPSSSVTLPHTPRPPEGVDRGTLHELMDVVGEVPLPPALMSLEEGGRDGNGGGSDAPAFLPRAPQDQPRRTRRGQAARARPSISGEGPAKQRGRGLSLAMTFFEESKEE
eukprot:TRINITY_DN8439_c0_g4_i2.p1 TRINITY_DN8439_c0_g4~~TRINITY_DN8439_c0_g4_i2.p1  ORF type:complete len:2549 (+),score=664.94 TRINITY_DN8439_c0_g4_i2:165-7811(+)